ncbi:uncharacterized protein LOC108087671 [Drosophila ficusphila]|uniref:uncharacterized protein LOC108087671 n=1 Tax=Drosophila ficusphila TaxID=30025 RepID=UPI0007E67B08|nr:uncharacterized protein LOC108087671 [Drosophila ficusphila]
MFAVSRLLCFTSWNRILKSRMIYQETIKRQFNDKLSEKGRGEELNYFLKLGKEQFERLRMNRLKEIAIHINELEAEIKKMETKTSRKSQKTREKLAKEIRELKEMLERFKKSLEKKDQES